MDKPWDNKFLAEVAAEYKLTPKQTPVFILRHGPGLSYRAIAQKANIQESNAQKHMTNVYSLFGITESSVKGKSTELNSLLYRLYQERKQKSDDSSESSSKEEISRQRRIRKAVNATGGYIGKSVKLELKHLFSSSSSLGEKIQRLCFALEDNQISEDSVIENFFVIILDFYESMSSTEKQFLFILLLKIIEVSSDRTVDDSSFEDVYKKRE